MKHIICLGDSNTHGLCADPSDCADGGGRFNESERWTKLLQKQLGTEEYLVIEEGLNNRTTVFPEPLQEGRAAIDYITPCLDSHAPVDLLIIMLGTNDSKDRFSVSAPCIGLGMTRLVKKAMASDCWRNGKPNILIVSPPPIGEGILTCPAVRTMGEGCVEKSRELAKEYELVAANLGVHFFDAGSIPCEFNQIDFMHLTKKGHSVLAKAFGELIPTLITD